MALQGDAEASLCDAVVDARAEERRCRASEMAMQGHCGAMQSPERRCKVPWKAFPSVLTAMQGVAVDGAKVVEVNLNVAVGRLDRAVVDARSVEWRCKVVARVGSTGRGISDFGRTRRRGGGTNGTNGTNGTVADRGPPFSAAGGRTSKLARSTPSGPSLLTSGFDPACS
jgi:hypothetical protein